MKMHLVLRRYEGSYKAVFWALRTRYNALRTIEFQKSVTKNRYNIFICNLSVTAFRNAKNPYNIYIFYYVCYNVTIIYNRLYKYMYVYAYITCIRPDAHTSIRAHAHAREENP